jgi:hypothetical protein
LDSKCCGISHRISRNHQLIHFHLIKVHQPLLGVLPDLATKQPPQERMCSLPSAPLPLSKQSPAPEYQISRNRKKLVASIQGVPKKGKVLSEPLSKELKRWPHKRMNSSVIVPALRVRLEAVDDEAKAQC